MPVTHCIPAEKSEPKQVTAPCVFLGTNPPKLYRCRTEWLAIKKHTQASRLPGKSQMVNWLSQQRLRGGAMMTPGEGVARAVSVRFDRGEVSYCNRSARIPSPTASKHSPMEATPVEGAFEDFDCVTVKTIWQDPRGSACITDVKSGA